MTVQHDVHHLIGTLHGVEVDARSLPWSAQRPWRCSRAISVANGLVCVDLHGLSVRLGRRVVEEALSADLSAGGFVVITGRGRHSGGHSRLRAAIEQQLSEAGVSFTPQGPGRFEVQLDRDRVRAARPGMGMLFWLLVALVLVGIAVSIFG